MKALIAEGGIFVDEKDQNGWTSLHFAAYKDHADVVHAVLAAAAIIDSKTINQSTTLHLASRWGSVEIRSV